MANVRRIEFGSDEISILAELGSFKLVLGGVGVVASTNTKQEMYETISRLLNDLHDIRLEFDYGIFKNFNEDKSTDKENDEVG